MNLDSKKGSGHCESCDKYSTDIRKVQNKESYKGYWEQCADCAGI